MSKSVRESLEKHVGSFIQPWRGFGAETTLDPDNHEILLVRPQEIVLRNVLTGAESVLPSIKTDDWWAASHHIFSKKELVSYLDGYSNCLHRLQLCVQTNLINSLRKLHDECGTATLKLIEK